MDVGTSCGPERDQFVDGVTSIPTIGAEKARAVFFGNGGPVWYWKRSAETDSNA